MLNSGGSESNVRQLPGVKTGDLEIVVSSVENEHEVRLLGELDMASAEQLQEELMRLTSAGATLVTVNLADLEFIDSTGLSVLITALKRLRRQGGDMALRSPSPATRKVLEITGLIEVFSVS